MNAETAKLPRVVAFAQCEPLKEYCTISVRGNSRTGSRRDRWTLHRRSCGSVIHSLRGWADNTQIRLMDHEGALQTLTAHRPGVATVNHLQICKRCFKGPHELGLAETGEDGHDGRARYRLVS